LVGRGSHFCPFFRTQSCHFRWNGDHLPMGKRARVITRLLPDRWIVGGPGRRCPGYRSGGKWLPVQRKAWGMVEAEGELVAANDGSAGTAECHQGAGHPRLESEPHCTGRPDDK
jgi:hypothetical protein